MPAVLALAAALLPTPGRAGDVQFAPPDDAVVRALYARLDPKTGLTPAAEPDVATGRAAPRQGREGCLPGFRVAELHTKDWKPPGARYRLAAFLVTTDNPPDQPLPCYHPEPWVCVLEDHGGGLKPVDCASVERSVFPNGITLDTAPFDLDERNRAFGVRLRHETGYRSGSEVEGTLSLFRLHDRRLRPVLTVPVLQELDDFGQGSACARELIVRVESTRTAGVFDWTVRVARNEGPGRCTFDPDPVGTYRWDGTRYVKADP